jgi:signal peptidase I
MTPRGQSKQSRLAAAAVFLAAGFALALLLPAVLPSAVGYRSYVIRSHSMEPSISRGDVLVSDPIPAREARVDDVVTFDDPEGDDMISHRVRVVAVRGGEAHFVTQGDANTGVERWRVPADAEVSRLSYTVPKVGYATLTAEDPQKRLILAGFALLVLAGVLMRRLRTDA